MAECIKQNKKLKKQGDKRWLYSLANKNGGIIMNVDRLKDLLYNAIVLLESERSEPFDNVEEELAWLEKEIGITQEELKEIGVNWLR